MDFAKAIKQNQGFRDEWEKAVLNIVYSGNWMYSRLYQFHKEFDVSPEQYNILRILKGQHPETASINLLKSRMLDKMSNASRLVEKLRKKGLAARVECPEDRRCVEVSITENGLALLDNIKQARPNACEEYAQITEEEAQTLNRILDKFREC